MNAARIATFCVIAIVVTIGVSRAQDEGPWWGWSTIDGNWGGFRQALADRGLVFSGTTVVDLQGNVSGGERRAFAPADASLVAADADLEKLAGLDGLLFHAEFVANAGEDLSTKSIGNILQVATAFAQPGYYLGQMYVQQKLFADVLTLQVGRHDYGKQFRESASIQRLCLVC
jgi:porin